MDEEITSDEPGDVGISSVSSVEEKNIVHDEISSVKAV